MEFVSLGISWLAAAEETTPDHTLDYTLSLLVITHDHIQGLGHMWPDIWFIKDIPIGNIRVQLGIELRKSWLINGILFNSEVWHGMKDSDSASFVILDQYLI